MRILVALVLIYEVRPIFDEDLREYCNKNYHQILPIIAKKPHQEKAQQEKLKAVKARLNFEEASRYSESETPSRRRNLKERLGPRKLPPTEKCIKDPVEIHNIIQRDEESTKEFVQRYKLEYRDVKGASECMKISGFMHGITYPELIKRPHEKIPKSMDEMMSEARQKQDFKRGNFQNEQRTERKQDRFTLLTKTPKEIPALDKGKFKPPPPMTTPVEKRNSSKFYEFHRETAKKGETSRKYKSLAILMVHSWQRIARQRITQTLSPKSIISFPTLGEEDRTEDLMIIEAEMGGHYVHCIYVDGGSSSEILKAMGKEDPSNPIRGARNNKIPSGWRNSHIAKQQDHPAIMLNGFRTRSTAAWEGRKELCELLRCHLNVFAWKPADMTRVPRHIFEHMLNVRKGCLPVRQKKRGQMHESNKVISEEVKKLVEAYIMKEVHYHSWLSNPVMVKKHDDSWRMCLDFKDFNKAEGTFLGYKVDADGLRVCPNKVEAVLNLPSPKCLKDVRKLNGKLASLNRFMSKLAEKSLPFFKTLKKCTKKSDFQWTAEAEVAFKGKKQLIAELPMLTAPKEKEELIMFLAAAKEAISYRPRTSVKRQILVDFIVERPEDDTPDMSMEDREELPDPWILFTDGSSCIDDSKSSLIITNPEGMEFTYALRFRFNATNNDADYEALIAGLRIPGQMGVQNLQANVDSKLVANQVNGIYIAKESNALSKISSTSFAHLSKQVLMEELREKSIDEKEILAVVEEEGYTWMSSVYEYLTEWILPEEKKKARAVRRKAGRYAVINEVLYKKSFIGLWLRCVGPLQANYVLREIHEGSCSMHAGPRSVVAKALRSCYYWPTMHTDARKLIRGCNDCQVHRPMPRNPQEKLTPITSP
uniref:Reverse transcriptase domain-containing protein n=1 Tax=Tanacetum cinerariifolium TaxID=118510 RepID=A0A699HFF6_TANCI|nr:reverse transcriptase domain-containing protein [Tanacetum cinerariifolium]